MTLNEIARRNLLRKKGKAAFVMAGLAIGVATAVGVIGFVDAMTMDINHKLEEYGANILILPRSENLSLTYGGMALGGVSFEIEEFREIELQKVGTIENARNIAALGPMVLGVVGVGGRKVLLAGVDFDASRILKPWWKTAGRLPGDGEVLAGAEAARILDLRTGDPISLRGRDLKVSGMLEPTGSQDDGIIFAPLSVAQSILGKEGRISMAEVAALCHDCPVKEMVGQISAALPGASVTAIQQVVEGRLETLSHFRKFAVAVSLLVILVGSMVVLVTMMGNVRERTAEIGIFRAIGFRRGHVMKIVLTEAAIVSGLAGVLGFLIGIGATRAGLHFFGGDHAVVVHWNLHLAAGAIIVSLLVGILSSIYPALVAARLDPNEALRSL